MIADGARHFDDFDGQIYLNCAHMGPLPRVTSQAIAETIALKAFPNRIADDALFAFPNRARAALAPLIGARPEEIFLGSGCAHAMGMAAVGFPWKGGDEVVVAATDFPSNVYAWSQAARRHGGRVRLVRGAKRAVTTDDMLDAIGPDTRAVVVSLVDFGGGEVMDLERLGAACAPRGVFLAVDATQAAGAMPLDLGGSAVSFVAAGAYKWLLGPFGTGFGWVSPSWMDRLEPVAVNWTAARGAEDFNALPREGWQWVETARRFDGAETASFLNVAGLIRSAEFIGEIGVEAIHGHVVELLEGLEGSLPAGFRRRARRGAVPGPILSIEADDPARVRAAHARARDAGIRVSLRDDGIRVSPHIYNSAADVERLLAALGDA